jgi:O-antigen/teichoic acid export membrane protein
MASSMALRGRLIVTVFLQVIGVLATILTNIIVAHRYGPDAQGYLSFIRSNIDVITNIGLFGLPQAFVFMINSKLVESEWAAKFSFRYTVVIGFIYTCVAGLIYLIGVNRTLGLDKFAIFSIAIASSGMLLHGLFRGISLTSRSTWTFNLVSISPFVLTFVFYFVWNVSDYENLVFASVAAALCSCVLGSAVLRDDLLAHNKWSVAGSAFHIKTAIGYGFWSLFPGISTSLVTALTYGLLRQGGTSEAIAGYFSISVLFLAASAMALNMVVPILFDTWSKEKSISVTMQTYFKLAHLGTVIAIVGFGLGLAIVEPLTILVFGRGYAPSVLSTKVLLLSIYALYQNRLLSAILLALGNPKLVATGAIIRAIVIILLLLPNASHTLTGAAVAWNMGELVSMFYMSIYASGKTGWSLFRIAGISPAWILSSIRSGFLVTRS